MAASAFALSLWREPIPLRSTLSLVLSKRLFHCSTLTSKQPLGLVSSVIGGVIRRHPFPYAAVRLAAGAGAVGFNPIRCRVTGRIRTRH
ncbi:hypothetical protein HPP92_021114 [Vanilla planifolia]|uniref:Uncharacterized protein n=1 Tax=Vanilla planifolia TaxID=51239 RepID=A0A835Q0F9_VANPL|nr:hypothetical protein HPP92_021114 [Vanilla planifolia]